MAARLTYLLLLFAAAASCSFDSMIIKHNSAISDPLSSMSSSESQTALKQYFYDRSTSNLYSFALTAKAYLIPVAILLGLQLVGLIYLLVRKIIKMRRPEEPP